MIISYPVYYLRYLYTTIHRRAEDVARQASDPYATWVRCCDHTGLFGHSGCNAIFEMMASALGRGRHGRLPSRQDAYYRDMSEMWAFHHFTPSILAVEDGEEPDVMLRRARELDAELAGALEVSGEPTLGIVWGGFERTRNRSRKFMAGVYFLTLLCGEMRKASPPGGGDLVLDLVEIGAGYGSVPRLLSKARRRLADLPPGRRVRVRSYQILDVRFVIDLQRWYLNRTAGGDIRQRDWEEPERPGQENDYLARVAEAGGWGAESGAPRAFWPPPGEPEAPLPVDFVDTNARDLFSHLYGEARSAELAGSEPAPVRALYAVNSWHEFPMPDFMWYYNNLIAAPVSRGGVQWILYISNRHWSYNDEKEALLLQPRTHFRFEAVYERCVELTCFRVLRRVP